MMDELLEFPGPGDYELDLEKFKRKATLEDVKSLLVLMKMNFKLSDDSYDNMPEVKRKAYKKINKYMIKKD